MQQDPASPRNIHSNKTLLIFYEATTEYIVRPHSATKIWKTGDRKTQFGCPNVSRRLNGPRSFLLSRGSGRFYHRSRARVNRKWGTGIPSSWDWLPFRVMPSGEGPLVTIGVSDHNFAAVVVNQQLAVARPFTRKIDHHLD